MSLIIYNFQCFKLLKTRQFYLYLFCAMFLSVVAKNITLNKKN